MTPEAREARNAYRRDYYKKHPEKQAQYTARYWEKKVAATTGTSKTAQSAE